MLHFFALEGISSCATSGTSCWTPWLMDNDLFYFPGCCLFVFACPGFVLFFCRGPLVELIVLISLCIYVCRVRVSGVRLIAATASLDSAKALLGRASPGRALLGRALHTSAIVAIRSTRPPHLSLECSPGTWVGFRWGTGSDFDGELDRI